MTMIKTFLADDSGAVTVDWVVLTAAIVGLGLAVVTSVRSGVGSLGTNISNSLSSASVATLDSLGVGE
jgi:Flp pilus assembly pilin Flp